ncbi:hypothetical protein CBR_g23359 [Chara braunii]|uniref:CCHC-type domain-containing protein n=1 Tax=Chara braunii TaxID=69332 RepID=A0A388L4A5_CHABU|nr:hypothetical protein CBR_g23359 [Chara braunii]|eukprot:GBG77033.1 hypothetical protein CBR_g23359 [Chara braunii]
MANTGQPLANRQCYNCGQLGHLSRFCPLPYRRFTFSATPAAVPTNPSTVFVTVPSTPAVNVPMAGVSGGYSGFNYGYGGGLRPRVESLEATVVGIKAHQDAEIAKEQCKKEEEEWVKKQNGEEERMLQEKKAREDFQAEMRNEMGSKLDAVRELLENKKSNKDDEASKLRVKIEGLRMALRNGQRVSTSENVYGKYKRDLEEEKARSDCRLAMEEEIARLRTVSEEANAAADVWRTEALRPGNKRGSVVVTATLVPGMRTRARMVSTHSPAMEDLKLKEKVEHQEHEIELLKEWRLRELNGRRQAEQVERLKEKMAKLAVERSTPLASNLKTRLDKVATTGKKGKKQLNPAVLAVEANDRDAFLAETRKFLKPLKKDKVVALCAKEGVTYSTLDKTKEDLALKRDDVAFGVLRGSTVKKGGVVIHEVTEGEEGGKGSTEVNDDSATS